MRVFIFSDIGIYGYIQQAETPFTDCNFRFNMNFYLAFES